MSKPNLLIFSVLCAFTDETLLALHRIGTILNAGTFITSKVLVEIIE